MYGFSYLDMSLLVAMYVWAVLGIELGFHRYLTHRSLKTNNWMRTFFVISGCVAGHGQPIWWCAIHRRHHQYSDHHGDPHSPNLHGDGLIGTIAIPAAIGGVVTQSWHDAWSAFLWGGLVRMFLDQHALWWGIVTVCHRFGYRTFQSHDKSTNHWLIAILFLGDGWHNNHHAFPASAKVGHSWWEYDPTWSVIKFLVWCRLAWDVKVPSKELIQQKRLEKSVS